MTPIGVKEIEKSSPCYRENGLFLFESLVRLEKLDKTQMMTLLMSLARILKATLA